MARLPFVPDSRPVHGESCACCLGPEALDRIARLVERREFVKIISSARGLRPLACPAAAPISRVFGTSWTGKQRRRSHPEASPVNRESATQGIPSSRVQRDCRTQAQPTRRKRTLACGNAVEFMESCGSRWKTSQSWWNSKCDCTQRCAAAQEGHKSRALRTCIRPCRRYPP